MKARLWLTYVLCAAMGMAVYFFLFLHIKWTLFPYVKALNVLFGFHFHETADGYEALGSGFAITETCGGVNLFISLYMILVFGFLRRFPGTLQRVAVALACVGIALLIAFLATLGRIIISLPFCEWRHFKLGHTVLSLCVFYGTGLWVYMRAQKIVRRICP